jgi:hypothetical protein
MNRRSKYIGGVLVLVVVIGVKPVSGQTFETPSTTKSALTIGESIGEYKQATERTPESEEAWLGLQLALLADNNWESAAEAGTVALRLNPSSFLAISRQAYIRFMQKDYSSAERLYVRALEEDPQNGEMILGLGFTKIYQGEAKKGYELCQKAQEYLKGDKRVDECLAMGKSRNVVFNGAAYGTYLHYTNPWNMKDLYGLTITATVNWPAPFGLWIGANMTETVLAYEADNRLQVNSALGIFYRNDGLSAGAAMSWIYINDKAVRNTKVVVLGVGYDKYIVGGGMGLSGSFYPDFSVLQLDPRLRAHIDDIVHISIGPELIVLGRGRPGPSEDNKDTDLLWSFHLGLTYYPISMMSLFVKGFYGDKSYAVEDEGISVWSNSSLFRGGYQAGVGFDIGSYFSITLSLRHEFGVKQDGMDHDFQLVGGVLGIYGRY